MRSPLALAVASFAIAAAAVATTAQLGPRTLSTACAAPCAVCAAGTQAQELLAPSLCVSLPVDAQMWRFRVLRAPDDAPRDPSATLLDAAAFDRVRDFALPTAVGSLAIEAETAPPTLAIDADTLAQWRGLETL